MAKNWWFKFDFRLWRSDADLRLLSLEARGFWVELLCVMHEKDTYTMTATFEELGWLIGCSPEVAARCIVQIKNSNVADVTLGNGDVTVLSRRLYREAKEREQSRLRVQKFRSNGPVTQQSKSKSNKKEKKKKSSPAAKASPDHSKLMSYHSERIKVVNDRAAQGKAVKTLLQNFTADDCIAYYNYQVLQLSSNGGWRDAVSWLSVSKTIGEWVTAGKPAEPVEKKNGSNKQSAKSNVVALQQSADYFERKYGNTGT
jgi:hypothetical protein